MIFQTLDTVGGGGGFDPGPAKIDRPQSQHQERPGFIWLVYVIIVVIEHDRTINHSNNYGNGLYWVNIYIWYNMIYMI